MLRKLREMCCSEAPCEVFLDVALMLREDQATPISNGEFYPLNILKNFYLEIAVDINRGVIIKSYDFLYILPEKAPLPENILQVNEKYHMIIRSGDRWETTGNSKYYLGDISLFEPYTIYYLRNDVKKDVIQVLHKSKNFKLILGNISAKTKNFDVSLIFESDPDYYKQNYEMDLKMAAAFSYYNNLPADFKSASNSDDLFSPCEKRNENTSISGDVHEFQNQDYANRKNFASFANSTASATNFNSSSQQGSFLSPEILHQFASLQRENNQKLNSSNRIKNRAISNDFSAQDDSLHRQQNLIKIQPFEAQEKQGSYNHNYDYRVNSKAVSSHHKKALSMNREVAYHSKNTPTLSSGSNNHSNGSKQLGALSKNLWDDKHTPSPNIYNLVTLNETPRDLNFFHQDIQDPKGPKREFLKFTFDALYGSSNKYSSTMSSKEIKIREDMETGEIVSEEGEEVITRGSEKQIISVLPSDFPHTIRNQNSLNNSSSSLNGTPNRTLNSQGSDDLSQDKRVYSQLNLKKSPKRYQQQRSNFNKRMSNNYFSGIQEEDEDISVNQLTVNENDFVLQRRTKNIIISFPDDHHEYKSLVGTHKMMKEMEELCGKFSERFWGIGYDFQINLAMRIIFLHSLKNPCREEFQYQAIYNMSQLATILEDVFASVKFSLL